MNQTSSLIQVKSLVLLHYTYHSFNVLMVQLINLLYKIKFCIIFLLNFLAVIIWKQPKLAETSWGGNFLIQLYFSLNVCLLIQSCIECL